MFLKMKMSQISHKGFFITLSLLFLVEFALLAISPYNREDWLLENVLVFLFVPFLAWTWIRMPLSKLSYGLIFLFLALHEIGAHYTYSLVPYDALLASTFGFSLNEVMGWERNHYDRLGHLLYGLLLTYPVRELYCRVLDLPGLWSYFLPLNLIMGASLTYELIEWGAAEVFGGELGIAYLGTQGDVWDAQRDMGLATLGAFIAMAITFVVHRRIKVRA